MIRNERLAAAFDDASFVVFMIGMRINRPWLVHKWLPVARAMPRMIRELAKEAEQLPAWRAFNKAVGTSGFVGIWHETYVAAPGTYESIYVNMPPFGLGRAGALFPATGVRQSAVSRMGAHKPVVQYHRGPCQPD